MISILILICNIELLLFLFAIKVVDLIFNLLLLSVTFNVQISGFYDLELMMIISPKFSRNSIQKYIFLLSFTLIKNKITLRLINLDNSLTYKLVFGFRIKPGLLGLYQR